MTKTRRPSYLDFDQEAYGWKPDIDYRKEPEKYRVGKGEQGVLICEPYKSEIGPHWRFKNPEIAMQSSQVIYQLFLEYLKNDEFVGADLARKYLQMGYTRARRYANYKGGKKYDKENDSSSWSGELGSLKKRKLPAFSMEFGNRPKPSLHIPGIKKTGRHSMANLLKIFTDFVYNVIDIKGFRNIGFSITTCSIMHVQISGHHNHRCVEIFR